MIRFELRIGSSGGPVSLEEFLRWQTEQEALRDPLVRRRFRKSVWGTAGGKSAPRGAWSEVRKHCSTPVRCQARSDGTDYWVWGSARATFWQIERERGRLFGTFKISPTHHFFVKNRNNSGPAVRLRLFGSCHSRGGGLHSCCPAVMETPVSITRFTERNYRLPHGGEWCRGASQRHFHTSKLLLAGACSTVYNIYTLFFWVCTLASAWVVCITPSSWIWIHPLPCLWLMGQERGVFSSF